MNEDKRRRLIALGEDIERAKRLVFLLHDPATPRDQNCALLFEKVRARLNKALDAAGLPTTQRVSWREAWGDYAAQLTELELHVAELLRDPEAPIAAATETAFAHLNRLLAVDKELQARWKKAFDKEGEVGCERLGAVHLLHHGLWAFKVNAEGQRTDLVYNETPIEIGFALTAARGLIITEWKKAKAVERVTLKGRTRTTQTQTRLARAVVTKVTRAASRQVEEYAEGVLRDTALLSTRYVVLVSMKQLRDLPERDGNVRFINIAIDRDSPSRT